MFVASLLVSTLLGLGVATTPAPAINPVAALERQAKDWNRGDLDAFCAIYADDATFVSPSGVTRGRAEILARYKKKYDTPEKRGTLSFEVIENRRKGHAASVMLRWRIQKKDGEASGYSLVVMHRTPSGWRIVQDASM